MESVKVAVRIRPLVTSEIDNGCRSCIERLSGEPQVSIGKNNQTFTFNYVFDENEGQGKVYNVAVKNLIDNLFKGYNLTILAYGQTGSGKTYSMGTNYSGDGELGIIPRAVYDIFESIHAKTDYNFEVSVSFLELYNESLYDLLTDKPREQSVVDMREQNNGICIPGLTELSVCTADDALSKLKEGSSGRIVGATLMNATSSRSHAVFTINIKIWHKTNSKEVMSSKFHLVDLAGSERSKKTGATGDRFKEGVNINKGLLTLGNVISQLCEGNHGFINYRDSKLTRLLQDSLGGNSVTLMIACVSPADYNQDESLSTLRYADRAKKIKNKPVVNQDPASAEISRLRKENEELRLKIIGRGISTSDCPPEHQRLESELIDSRTKISELSEALILALAQNANMHERTIMADKLEETLKEKLDAIDNIFESSTTEPHGDVIRDMRSKFLEIKVELSQMFRSWININVHEPVDQFRAEQERISMDQKAHKGYVSHLESKECPGTPTRHEHILAQAKINKEIDAITKSLVWKEELILKLCESANHLGEIGEQDSIGDLKQQILELQKEKEELQQQMKDTALTTVSANAQSKLSEQRRKRLQELEQKVASLMKKVAEQERIIKMKESSEEKIKTLKNEILVGKQLKVRLIQQMKSENDKYRSWKMEKDREVCLLRTQNMRKQNQLKKMEQIHNMQQNVLKRKLEAAAAANKRIMAALERQKAAKLKRMKSSMTERIRDKLAEELELIESEYQAQKSLESLIQDRAVLNKELAVIKENLEDSSVSQEEVAKLHKDMKEIEDDLAMRSAEISDLQQKLLDIHQDDKTRGNWDILQTMNDAKFAVSYVISLVSDRIKDVMNMTQQFAELKEQLAEQEVLSSDRKRKLEEYIDYHEQAIERIEKEYEEKVYVLLKRLKSPENENDFLSETEKIHLLELDKVDELRKRIKELEGELMSRKPKNPENSFQDAFNDYVGAPNTTVTKNFTPEKNNRRLTFDVIDENKVKPLDSTMEMDFHVGCDADYLNTPLYKRLKSLQSNSSQNNSGDENIAPKRLKLTSDPDNEDAGLITLKPRPTIKLLIDSP